LDPMGRREVRDLILSLKKEGKTVFFSTHILNDVETLCDRVAIVNHGKLVGSGCLSELISREITHTEIVIANMDFAALRQALGPDVLIKLGGTTLRVELEANRPLAPLVEYVERASGKILAINSIRQTMEDYFFRVVNDDKSRRT